MRNTRAIYLLQKIDQNTVIIIKKREKLAPCAAPLPAPTRGCCYLYTALLAPGRFCYTKRMRLLEDMKAACPSLVRGRQSASLWEQHCVLEKGKQQGGRWSEPMSGQGTGGDTAESSHTGCRHHVPAEPCPKCNTWPSPNGTKICCSESNLPASSQFCKWVANLSFLCCLLWKSVLQQLTKFWFLQYAYEQAFTIKIVVCLKNTSQLRKVNYWHWILTKICVFIHLNIDIHMRALYNYE